MNNQAIGVFDSGIGGLTAVREIMRILPNENIVYFGDTSRVPYGTRSDETVVKYVRQDISFLKSFDIKAVVVACGTASSIALNSVKDEVGLPILGVVDCSAHFAATKTKNKKIGVLGTPGTIRSDAYRKEIMRIDDTIQVFNKACPLFVPMVENGHYKKSDKLVQLCVQEYLQEFVDANVDTIIMGCTHYPLLREAIQDFVGENVTLVDPGVEISKELKCILSENDIQNDSDETGDSSFYVSDSIQSFSELANIFLGKNITGTVGKIDIDKF